MKDYPDLPLEIFIDVGTKLADRARIEAMRWFRCKALTVDNKDSSQFDPVTNADIAVEKVMRDILGEIRPNDSIVGEEIFSEKDSLVAGEDAEICWVLDPIDGTRSFIAGMPLWGIMISANYRGIPFFGMIDHPATCERVWGIYSNTNRAAFYIGANGDKVPLQTRQNVDLSTAFLTTTHPEHFERKEQYEAFCQVAEKVRMHRFGGDCYQYTLLSMGFFDLVLETGLKHFDIRAAIPIIRAAGGLVTNWEGDENACACGGSVVAAGNAVVHRQVLELIGGI